jgi:hypothetical protein
VEIDALRFVCALPPKADIATHWRKLHTFGIVPVSEMLSGNNSCAKPGAPLSVALLPTGENPIFRCGVHQPNQDVGVSAARFFSLAIAEASSS